MSQDTHVCLRYTCAPMMHKINVSRCTCVPSARASLYVSSLYPSLSCLFCVSVSRAHTLFLSLSRAHTLFACVRVCAHARECVCARTRVCRSPSLPPSLPPSTLCAHKLILQYELHIDDTYTDLLYYMDDTFLSDFTY